MSKLLYPSWRYHATLPARIVNNPEEDEGLGPGWADSPAVFMKEAREGSAEGDAVPDASAGNIPAAPPSPARSSTSRIRRRIRISPNAHIQ